MRDKYIQFPQFDKQVHLTVEGNYIGGHIYVKGVFTHIWSMDEGKTFHYEILNDYLLGAWVSSFAVGYGRAWYRVPLINNLELVDKEGSYLVMTDLNKANTANKKEEQSTILKKLAPKTGRYRASLPKEHPQANQLQSDPHSYARFEKDDTFTYEGLEEYDLGEITWTFTAK
ncbi:hypothetical protein MNB_SM-4-1542 [hydrothermal vent metagenome]|uniref:Uncharacterized protein n=1 Tax=hydrothermal vent metagenome TaxID=652676 RepID=A0A1W1C1U0_9ZZZZ